MIWSVNETIAALSCLVALEPGDLIFHRNPRRRGRRGSRRPARGAYRRASRHVDPHRLTVDILVIVARLRAADHILN